MNTEIAKLKKEIKELRRELTELQEKVVRLDPSASYWEDLNNTENLDEPLYSDWDLIMSKHLLPRKPKDKKKDKKKPKPIKPMRGNK